MTPDRMEHTEAAESLAAYVLGALPEDEASRLGRHLEACDRCRQELARLRAAADTLPATAPQVPPPPALKERVMAVVESEAELLRAAGPAADRPPPRRGLGRRRRRLLVTAGVAAVAATATVAVGLVLVGRTGPSQPGGRVVAAQIAAPDVAANTRAWIRISDGRATLVVRGMPWPPPGRVYQVWVKPPGRSPVPAGAIFAVRSGSIEIPRRLQRGEQVMVSNEPDGGSLAPTQAPLIVSSPV